MTEVSTSLAKNANYRRILTAVGLGAVSSGAANIGLDLVAVIVLNASAFQIGLINAVGTVSYLIFSLPVGALVDRLPKNRIMALADVTAAVALLWIPIGYALGLLEYWQLLAVSFLAGFAGMLFSIASKSVLPSVVDGDRLTDAYSRQESVTTSIEIAAPVIFGQVLRFIAAPYVLIVSVVARLASAFASARILADITRDDEVAEPYWASLRSGLKFSATHKTLRLIVLSTAIMNLGLAIGSAIETVFYVRTLSFSAPEIGFVLSATGLGGLLGTLAAPVIVNKLGSVGSFLFSTVGSVFVVAFLPIISFLNGPLVIYVAIQACLYAILVVVYNVNSYTLAGTLTPKAMLGRQMSFMGFAGMGVVPLGSLAGGLLGDGQGYVFTLWVWVALSAMATVPVIVAAPRIRAELAAKR